MKAGKIVLLVVGIIVLLISLAPLLAGGGLMWAEKAIRGPDGFYTTPRISLKKDSYAIVTKPTNIDLGGEWQWPSWLGYRKPSELLSVKIEGSSRDTSKQVFIGIAPASDLENYLKDVEYDEVTDFGIRRATLDYTNHPGALEPEVPITQTFWVASAYGKEVEALQWGIEEGTYSVALMNADGSRGLDLSVSVGIKIPPMISKIATWLLVAGAILLAVAILLIVLAARKPRTATM